jgi:hypothetical protein
MVVGLPQGAGIEPAMQAAADLAEFLQIELLGTFIADPGLRALTGLPVRELRILDRQWQPIDLEQISRDLEGAAATVRSHFDACLGSRSIKARFDVIAGTRVLSSLIRTDDIVVIIEPAHPGERVTQQFTGLFDAAFARAAGILVLPRRIARSSGPVMTLATGPDDPSIGVALEVAAALNERLIVVARPGSPLSPQLVAEAKRLGVDVRQVAGAGDATAVSTSMSLAPAKERLRVVARSLLPGDAARLFLALQGVPLLAVGSDRAGVLDETKRRDEAG